MSSFLFFFSKKKSDSSQKTWVLLQYTLRIHSDFFLLKIFTFLYSCYLDLSNPRIFTALFMKIHFSVLSVEKSLPEKWEWEVTLTEPIIIFTGSGQNLCKWVISVDYLSLICWICNMAIFLQKILPKEWPYNVVSFSQNGSHYLMKLVLPGMGSTAEIRSWTENFIRLNQCVYIRNGSKRNRSRLTPFSVNLRIFWFLLFLHNQEISMYLVFYLPNFYSVCDKQLCSSKKVQ